MSEIQGHSASPPDAKSSTRFLASDDVRRLTSIQPLKALGYIALQWVIILGIATFAVVSAEWYVYILAIIIIGTRQHALAVLVHDAAHGSLFRKRSLNDTVSDLFLAFPLFVSTSLYRKHHVLHHQYLNTDQDPDLMSKEFSSLKQWLGLFAADLVGISAIKALRTISNWSIISGCLNESGKAVSPGEKYRFLGFILTVAAILFWLNAWPEFLLLWILPMLTILNAIFRLRNVSEHLGCSNQSILTASRAVEAGFLERFLVAPCNVNYHLDHHLYPQIPFYNLPQLHKLLQQNPDYAANAHLTPSYCSGQRSVIQEILSVDS